MKLRFAQKNCICSNFNKFPFRLFEIPEAKKRRVIISKLHDHDLNIISTS